MKYRKRQNELLGKLFETCRKENTSPIIKSITKPRYASTEATRFAGNAGLIIGGAAVTTEFADIISTGIYENYKRMDRNDFVIWLNTSI